MKRISAWIVSACLILACACTLGSCSGKVRSFEDESKLNITATLFPQYDFASTVGGDRVEVIQLLYAGADSHTYEPSAADITMIYSSDLFIYTGSAMEPWAEKILKDENAPRVLDLSEYVTLIEGDHEHVHADEGEHEHEHEAHADGLAYDPHIWTSPVNAAALVSAVRDTLIEIDPDGAELYRANADDYISQLNSLDARLRETFEGRDELLVFGERFAFAYLTHEYGIRAISPYHGCSEDSEVSAADLESVINTVKENDIDTVFYEEMRDPITAKTIAEATGAELKLLHSCHTITKAELEAGETFLSIMTQNVDNLIAAVS